MEYIVNALQIGRMSAVKYCLHSVLFGRRLSKYVGIFARFERG